MYAQDRRNYKYVGIVGLGDIHWMQNMNAYGSEDIKGKLTWGYQYGAKFGWDVHNKHKFEIGILKMKAGQRRAGDIGSIPFEEILDMNYYVVPVMYKFVLGDVSQFFRNDFQMYVGTGLRFGYLSGVASSYKIDEKDVDFYAFHTINNDRLNEIISNPNVTDGSELFKPWDVMWQGFVGATYFFMDYIAVELGVEGGVSVLDINKPEWQIKDQSGSYSPSRNAYIGLNLSLVYYFPYW